LGYFVWKITILRQKIIFFSILGGVEQFLQMCTPLTKTPSILINIIY
jgi:hypothetical protein